MQTSDIEHELALVRAQLMRLRLRELHLQEALNTVKDTPPPLRPGWPIQRMAAQPVH
ncbi:hypothetical protein [Pseudotabrizicola algicola]|uniref:Uncharacterized protein n=1 Tax=Pseudotabrizicola algicola TaxID=2709381 RepID=A0A6B3RHX8_9RHOB|nr:hypothetical protein [Pseudotabrizicola algicola]NEX45637.1 hypothetical protein [Pseudotabrizicola algicola]